jgi:hypothetical protein
MNEPLRLSLYKVKQVGSDFLVLADDNTEIKITFADREPDHNDAAYSKEDEAAFFRHTQCLVGLEAPVRPFNSQEGVEIDIFLDHFKDDVGNVKSVPFPFQVKSIETTAIEK